MTVWKYGGLFVGPIWLVFLFSVINEPDLLQGMLEQAGREGDGLQSVFKMLSIPAFLLGGPPFFYFSAKEAYQDWSTHVWMKEHQKINAFQPVRVSHRREDMGLARSYAEALQRKSISAVLHELGHKARGDERFCHTVLLWSAQRGSAASELNALSALIDAWVDGTLQVVLIGEVKGPLGFRDQPNTKFTAIPANRKQWDSSVSETARRVALIVDRARKAEIGSGSNDVIHLPGPVRETHFEDSSSNSAFVSYSRRDQDTVREASAHLASAGARPWIDQASIESGEAWPAAIVEGIRSRNVFVLFCSASAYESDNVIRELCLAAKYRKALFPIILEESAMPASFEYFLVNVQLLPLFAQPKVQWPDFLRREWQALRKRVA